MNPSQIKNITRTKTRSKGVALITVLLVVALVSILAMQMTTRLQLQIQRSTNASFNQQAYWLAMGAESFAKRVLIAAFQDEKSYTHLGQAWNAGATTYPVEYGEISGEISDAQACLNLNALSHTKLPGNNNSNATPNNPNPSNPANSPNNAQSPNNQNKSGNKNSGQNQSGSNKPILQLALVNLITSLELDYISQFEAENMVDALIDWLDSDSSISSAGGAEDNDYSAKEFPYLAANNNIASVNELRVIDHFTPQVINALKPYVCVIPDNDIAQININTLSEDKPLLLAAILDISESEASRVLSEREEKGYENINDFYSSEALSGINLNDEHKKLFVVDSEYFTLKTTTRFNNSYFSMSSLLRVEENQEISVIARTVGRFYE